MPRKSQSDKWLELGKQFKKPAKQEPNPADLNDYGKPIEKEELISDPLKGKSLMQNPTLTTSPIRIINPSIDDFQNTVVIRGILDLDSLQFLKTDLYQRELLPSASRKHIITALENNNRLPDIILGMRGDTFQLDPDTNLLLCDPVFIIDGQQRTKSILQYLANCKSTPNQIRIGATIHLNTTSIFERELFQKLNQFQAKVSPNILLRNNKEDHPLIATFYGLTKSDKNFILFNRVCWQQNQTKTELMSAVTMSKIILQLHAHISPGRHGGSRMILEHTNKLLSRIGLPIARANTKTFYELIDTCWGIARIHIKSGAPYMRSAFQEILARCLSDHPVFWKNDKRLEIDYTWKKKLRSFPFQDPEIIRLCGSGGASRFTLYMHLLNHLNSGKRLNRLVSRTPSITFESEEALDEEEDRETA
jgi:hypothetical protein